MSVPRAITPARGMSRSGVCDSSAASGSSSMPRKNHIAKGSANRMGRMPSGRNTDEPTASAFGAMSHSLSHEKAPETSAMTENSRMIAMAMIDTTMAKRNEMCAPAALSATKAT